MNTVGMTSMVFVLPEPEDGWPPFRVECLYGHASGDVFRPKQAPFFLKGLSVDDHLRVTKNADDEVVSWSHVRKSSRSVVWIMQLGEVDLDGVVSHLRLLGCNTEYLREFAFFAIDVPEELSMAQVDSILAGVPSKDVAIAYPSVRHRD